MKMSPALLALALCACQSPPAQEAAQPAPSTDLHGARLINPEIAGTALDGIEIQYIPEEMVARFTVTANGMARNCRVIWPTEASDGIAARRLCDALKDQARFEPARVDGKPVPVEARQGFHYPRGE